MESRRADWRQKPRLRQEAGERKVSWLELFFDLVFVVVIAELAHSLATHVSWDGALSFVLLFVPVWSVWIGATFYNQRFETEDVSYRVFTFLQMLTITALAVFVHDGLGYTSVHFALSYVAARVVLTFMWLRGGWHAPDFRPVSNRYALGFIISTALFSISVFVPTPGRFILWASACF